MRSDRRASLAAARRATTQDGIALPMAMLTLLLLTSLALVLVSLTQSEPTIASNQLLATRARAMAEGGVELAMWALTHPTAPGGFGGAGVPPNVTVSTAAVPPYDGSTFVGVGSTGGFHVTVTGTDANLRTVRSLGWSPTSERSDARIRSRSEVTATIARVRNLAHEIPCALCFGAAATIGSSTVDARGSDTTDCGGKVAIAGTASVGLAVDALAFGAGAPAMPAASVEGRDWIQNATPGVALSAADLETLKRLAIAHGTYVRPPDGARVDLINVRSGVVFVDSPAGTTAIGASNLASVAIGPGFAGGNPFHGWIVVNGDVALLAGATVEGLVYAANTLTTEESVTVSGALVARQALGTASAISGLRLAFACVAARGGGGVPVGWLVRPGTYCDGTAGC